MVPLGNERWQALSPYLDRALDLEDVERAQWIAELRGSAPIIAADLERLLHDREALEREAFLAGSPTNFEQPASLAGLTIGAYTLTSLIGQGGMGSVWLAERSDGRFEGKAAVKLLNPALVGGAGSERFTREGSILARLDHPSVARLLDAGVSSLRQPYLVLEYIEGEHIDRYCERRGLDVDARLRLFLHVLDAVAHAHANLIVHRDIKPSNVLVTDEGRVKLLDFGIAKLIAEAETPAGAALTVDGARVLTPEYAAPEQMTGGPVTTATDVYALGVLLYVLLGGRHPAGATTTPADLLKAIVETNPPPLSEVAASPSARRALKGDLDNIVGKALKKDPAARYASVGAFADDLRRYFACQPVSARADSRTYRAAKFVRRQAAALTVLLLFIAAAAGLSAFHAARLTAERDRAQLEAEKSARMTDLLMGLLTAADPYGDASAREPTVRQLLDAGAERVDTDLAGQPALQAEMLTVMGRVYQRLGANETARPLLERALGLIQTPGVADETLRAQVLNQLGVLQLQEGDARTAANTLEQAVHLRRTHLGPEHEDLAASLVELGRSYVDQGLGARAEPLFRESLAIRRKVLGEEHRDTATSLSDLALLLWEQGDTAAAEPLFEQVLAINRSTVGNRHPNTASSLNNLGLIALDRGNWPHAEARLREALEISRETVGSRHSSVATQLNNLTHALREQGKYDQARAAVEEALRIAFPSLGADHSLVTALRMNLARVHLGVGDGAAAEAPARQALAARQRGFPDDDWRVAAARSLLGGALALQGRYREAEGLLLQARRHLKDVPGPQGREATAAAERLAGLYDASGRPDDAASIRAAGGRH